MLDRLCRGGTEGHVLALIESLDRRRFTPHLVLLAQSVDERDPLEPADCAVLRLGVSTFRELRTSFAAMRQLVRTLQRWEIDLLQIYSPDSTYFGVPAARAARVPVVIRALRNTGYWARRRDRVLQRLFSRRVDWTLTNGEACRRAAEDLGADPAAISVIRNGISLKPYRGVGASRIGTEPGSVKRIGIVANLRPVKRLDLLFHAAARIGAVHPDVRFEVAGEGSSRRELEALLEDLKLVGRVVLHGVVEDIPSFLETLDVAVLCSESEGLSNALIEYMAAARPIVATAVGGNGELITHEETGLLIPPRNVDALASAICRLLDDRELAQRLGQAARERAFSEFSLERQNALHEELWNRLFGDRRPSQDVALPERAR